MTAHCSTCQCQSDEIPQPKLLPDGDVRVNDETDWAAIVMCARADRWFWNQREICGFTGAIEPPCVKSPGHEGRHDGTYAAGGVERLNAWLAAGGPVADPDIRRCIVHDETYTTVCRGCRADEIAAEETSA